MLSSTGMLIVFFLPISQDRAPDPAGGRVAVTVGSPQRAQGSMVLMSVQDVVLLRKPVRWVRKENGRLCCCYPIGQGDFGLQYTSIARYGGDLGKPIEAFDAAKDIADADAPAFLRHIEPYAIVLYQEV